MLNVIFVRREKYIPKAYSKQYASKTCPFIENSRRRNRNMNEYLTWTKEDLIARYEEADKLFSEATDAVELESDTNKKLELLTHVRIMYRHKLAIKSAMIKNFGISGVTDLYNYCEKKES